MEPVRFWAAVRFCAQNGSTEAFLSAAAREGLHLFSVTPLPGGVRAHCAARCYSPLAALARKYHVRLRVQKRLGLFFHIRALLRRAGLWMGIIVFVPLLLWSQGLVWFTDYGALTAGQKARAAVVLREKANLSPGSPVTEEKLAAGEYALLQSGEFSWASLNFLNGRLSVEAAAAKPVPDIAAGTLHGIRAKAAGVVVSTNLVSGTMLVVPGQQIEAGQGLIGTARSERDGTLIFEPAAGSVRAQLVWQGEYAEPLQQQTTQLSGETFSEYRVSFAGHTFALPQWKKSGFEGEEALVTRHTQPDLWGLPLPFSVEETAHYRQTGQEIVLSDNAALALARLHSLQDLTAAYPDVEIKARKEAASVSNGMLHFRVAYTIVADICE